MGERIKVGFFLSKKLVEDLRSLIQRKYSHYEKGLLSYEAELALRHWLALHTRAQKNSAPSAPNPTPKVSLVFAEVKEYLLRNYYDELKPGQQIAAQHLVEAIMATRGPDHRTVKKWLNTFQTMKLVKPITPMLFEIL